LTSDYLYPTMKLLKYTYFKLDNFFFQQTTLQSSVVSNILRYCSNENEPYTYVVTGCGLAVTNFRSVPTTYQLNMFNGKNTKYVDIKRQVWRINKLNNRLIQNYFVILRRVNVGYYLLNAHHKYFSSVFF